MVRVPEVVDDGTPEPEKPAAKAPAKKAPKTQPKKAKPQAAALQRFLAGHEKKFGARPHIGGNPVFTGYDVVPTGSMVLDYRLGIGGFPVGRMTEIYGRPSTCKSLVALRAMGEAQRKWPDRYTGWLDIENSWTDDWARAQGVDPEQTVLISSNDMATAEEQLDLLYHYTTSGLMSFVGLDSVGAMLPNEEFEKGAAEASVGTMAKLLTRASKKVLAKLPEHGVCFVAINQMRDVIGPRGGITTGGGNAWKHNASIQLYARDSGNKLFIMESDGKEKHQREVGKDVTFKVEKSKLFSPGASALLSIVHLETDKYGPVGLNRGAEAIAVGRLSGVIEVGGGGYYTLPCGERIRGESGVSEFLAEHPEEIEAIRTAALAVKAPQVVDDYPELHRDGPSEDEPETVLDLDQMSEAAG